MTKKIFGVNIEGAYDRYQKNKENEAVKKPTKSLEKLEDFYGTPITKNDFDAIQDIYKKNDGVLFTMSSSISNYMEERFKGGYIGIENNRITHLELKNSNIKDIEAIGKLTKLNYLNLWDNPITNTNPIRNLKNLQKLFLWSNQLSKESKKILEELIEKGVDVHYNT